MRAARPAAALAAVVLLMAAAGAGRPAAGRWSEGPANPCKLKPGGSKGICDKRGNWIVETLNGKLVHTPDGRRYLVPPPLPATG